MPGPFYDLTAGSGLHILKNKWGQKAYLQQQCRHLAEHLDDAFQNTEIRHREQNYFPRHAQRQIINNPEAQWERAIWRRWKEQRAPTVPESWTWIVDYQIPLYDERGAKHYRAIDLLGIDNEGTLVVVELKKPPHRQPNERVGNSDSPLKMLLEASAYAQVIRQNWNHFQDNLANHLKQFYKWIPIPNNIDQIRLVGVAPEAYWLQWVPVSNQGVTVSRESWEAFRTLLLAFNEKNLQVSFVSLSGSVRNWRALMARHLKGFPLG
jgi:hypothetical protein